MPHLSKVINATSVKALPDLRAAQETSQVEESVYRFINEQRNEIKQILSGEDSRLLVIIGPCSIHDPEAAMEYASRLAKVQNQYQNSLKIVMRTYFEKPRTRNGWKGYIVDPDLNGEFDFEQGLSRSRSLLKSVLQLGIPTATEFLDTNIAPYIADLVCWGAIGARTTESQPHRQLASALDCPVGFKNGTDGNTAIAIDAIHAARDSHLFIVPGTHGSPTAVQTRGNQHCHIILRGGLAPNYSSPHVRSSAYHLEHAKLSPRLVVDCSHGNSGKIAKNQLNVVKSISDQLIAGEENIAGVMCESFLEGGSQKLGRQPLTYGRSITDECLNWQDTIQFLDTLAEAVEYCHQARYPKTEIA